jgi:hypothetical protein
MPSPTTNLPILTSDSVESLRQWALRDPVGFYRAEPEQIRDDLNLKFSTSNVVLNLGALKEPQATNNHDVENAFLFQAMVPSLSPALAADNRIWPTLALLYFPDYVRARYSLRLPSGLSPRSTEGREKLSRYVNSHWFADSARQRWRDNALGRLWWMAHVARGAGVGEERRALKALVQHDLDIYSWLLGKPSISSSPVLLAAIVECIIHDQNFANMNGGQRRECFRDFMKDLDLVLGRRVMSALPLEDVLPDVRVLYEAKFSGSSK